MAKLPGSAGEAPTGSALPIPVTVIGGYLGAGKTTLLNHLLHHNQGRRIAVLVNDFGAVNIDARLITSHDGETISLANGCICCSLAAGFLTVLNALRERTPAPEMIVVEASGVALPHKIAQYGRLPGFRLDGVIVLVDVETIRARARDRYVGRTVLRQLDGADLLVLTKTDLVSAEHLAAVRAWLQTRAPGTPQIASEHGVLPLSVVFGAGSEIRGAPADIARTGEAGESHEVAHETTTLHWDQPVPGEAMRAFAAALPGGVLRAKGLAWLAEQPERATVFQLVGKRWSLTPGAPWSTDTPGTDLVFIGLPGAFAGEDLAQQFAEMVESPFTPAPSPCSQVTGVGIGDLQQRAGTGELCDDRGC